MKRVIDKAIDYDRLIAGDNANTVYWERSDRTISSSDLSTFQRLTVKLIVENPSPYLVGALKNYIDSGLYFKGDPTAIDLRSSEGLIMSNVFNDHIRNVGINLLRGLNISDNSVTPIYNIFYANTLIGIILILTGIILAVWRKLVAVIFVAVVIKSSIIFLTMPIPSVYYYYPLGLSGSLLILLTVVHYRKDFFQMMNRFTKQLS